MDDFFGTVAIAGGGGLHLYFFFNLNTELRIWLPAAVIAAIFFAWMGVYPAIWPRGEGFFTPNRVAGFLIYLNVFSASVFLADHKYWYDSWLKAARGRHRDHRP